MLVRMNQIAKLEIEPEISITSSVDLVLENFFILAHLQILNHFLLPMVNMSVKFVDNFFLSADLSVSKRSGNFPAQISPYKKTRRRRKEEKEGEEEEEEEEKKEKKKKKEKEKKEKEKEEKKKRKKEKMKEKNEKKKKTTAVVASAMVAATAKSTASTKKK